MKTIEYFTGVKKEVRGDLTNLGGREDSKAKKLGYNAIYRNGFVYNKNFSYSFETELEAKKALERHISIIENHEELSFLSEMQ